jgi:hypothetical protein
MMDILLRRDPRVVTAAIGGREERKCKICIRDRLRRAILPQLKKSVSHNTKRYTKKIELKKIFILFFGWHSRRNNCPSGLLCSLPFSFFWVVVSLEKNVDIIKSREL